MLDTKRIVTKKNLIQKKPVCVEIFIFLSKKVSLPKKFFYENYFWCIFFSFLFRIILVEKLFFGENKVFVKKKFSKRKLLEKQFFRYFFFGKQGICTKTVLCIKFFLAKRVFWSILS